MTAARLGKSAIINQKNAAVAKAVELKTVAEEEYPELHPFDAWLTWFVDNSDLAYFNGRKRGELLRSRDIPYPFIRKSKSEKTSAYCPMTASGPPRTSRALPLHVPHQIDRFFMQVRCSLAGLRRAKPRRASRKWHLYGFSSSQMIEKCLNVYRPHFNYAKTG